ncbi:MAG: biotin--[acetyl-CoA-carboxylase] ligase [Bdellovibrionales bacterium]
MQVGLRTQQWAQRRQIPVEYFPSIESTSSYSKSLLNDPQENLRPRHLVVAESQTHGRGRGLNSWINPQPGTSLLSTWSFRLTRPPQPIMSARIGLALYRAITKAWAEAPFSLKAPNDLYLGSKKVAGLLLEAVEQGPHIRLFVGLGLNVLASPSLETATDLGTEISPSQLESNWDLFLDELLKEFQSAADQVSSQLTEMETRSLLQALNANPNLQSVYDRVEPDGSLLQGSKRIAWTDL